MGTVGGLLMLVGVQATFPLALDVAPSQIVRTQSPNAVPYYEQEVIYQCPWMAPALDVAEVEAAWIEYGNEVPVADWPAYYDTFRAAAPVLLDAGRKVCVAAASAQHTEQWLSTFTDWDIASAAAVHPYEQTPRAVLEHLQMARALVPRRLPLIVTEFGWSPTAPATSVFHAAGLIQQAKKLRRTFALLRENAEALNLHAALWFCWKSYPPTDPEKHWHDNGLIDVTGYERPAMDAFREACK